jgi:hypothetical protein
MPPEMKNGHCPRCGGKESMPEEIVSAWKKEAATYREAEKQERESRDCRYFIEAYEFAIEQKFDAEVEKSESPDFICTRRDGSIFGIELTALTGAPSSVDGFSNCETTERSAEVTVDEILRLAEQKAEKVRKAGAWKTRQNLLVFQLHNLSLSDLCPYLDVYKESVFEVVNNSPFGEIWIADFVGNHGDTLEAYDAVNLFALHPEHYWGYYENPNATRKPFG